jgi:carbonic anhydrase
MRLFEAIVDANQRAARGEDAGLRPGDHAASLPIVALTCIDPRLNPLLPGVLGIPEAQFIWLRNAGNVITGPVSSTMRSIALACAVKGGKEIAIIGHTDCKVRHTSASDLIERFRALGIDRSKLPDNVNEFFGLFASERTNVIKAVDFVRQSPLISAAMPVHGLLVDISSGALEWLVNGYNALATGAATAHAPQSSHEKLNLPSFNLGEMKFPEMKIGELARAGEIHSAIPEPVSAAPAPGLKMKPSEVIPLPPKILRAYPKQR